MRIIDFADGFESSEQPTSVSLPAAMVSNEPSGNLSADNIQDAVNELQVDVDTINAKVGAANGIATLDSNSKIPASQIPAVALVDVFQVADIAARDTLTVEAGDVAVVADIGDGVSQSYWYNGSTWVEVVADAALATHIADNTNPHGVTKSQVGLDQVDNTSDSTKNSATATLTNKTIGDALTVTQVATPAAPASGFNKIYAKADGSFYTLNSAGIESPVGSGSGGSKNYLGTVNKINGNGDFELGTTSKWSLGNVSINSTTKFPTGAPTFGSGASGNLAISVVSSGQLAGSYSLSYASSAATTAGNFFASDAFTIDKADQAKPQKFQFSYEAVTNPNNGNYSGTTSNSFGVAIYDVTNSAWIQPSGCFSMTQNAGVGIASGEFQTSSNGTSYRIVVYNANATSGATTLYFDDYSIGSEGAVLGAAITDWKPATLTSNFTNATVTGFEKSNGDTASYKVRISFTGTPGSISFGTITLPSGRTIDTSKLVGTNSLFSAINGSVTSNRGGAGGRLFLNYSNTTSVSLQYISSTTGTSAVVTHSTPIAFVSGDYIEAEFSVPIVGWSSNTTMSSDTSTRVVAMSVKKTSGSHTSSGSYQDVGSWDSVIFDETGSFNSTTGEYTVKTSGIYEIAGQIAFNYHATGSRVVSLVKTGVTQYFGQVGIPTASAITTLPFTFQVKAIAGDVLKLQGYQNSGGNLLYAISGENHLHIKRLSGPATIAASETVSARYTSSAGQSIANAATPIIDFGTKSYDSHNAVTTGASWKFTAPMSGEYSVDSLVRYANSLAWTSGSYVGVLIYKNGSSYSYSDTLLQASITPAQGPSVIMTDKVKLLAGEYIDIRTQHGESSARGLVPAGNLLRVTITKTGNY